MVLLYGIYYIYKIIKCGKITKTKKQKERKKENKCCSSCYLHRAWDFCKNCIKYWYYKVFYISKLITSILVPEGV